MKHVFRIVWESIKEFWDELFILVLMNLLTAVLFLPVVTLPPALAALWNVGNLVARGQGIEWGDYFRAFKRYFGKSWLIALINIGVGLLFYVNFNFYAPDTAPFNISETVSLWLRTFFVFLGVLWLFLQMYLFAMLLEQDEQRIKLAFRNAAILMFANPGFTLLLGIILALLSVASTLLPALWAMVTLSLIAVVCNKAVQHLLIPHRERALNEAAESAEAQGEETPSEEDGEDV
jgi:uncharacterized membrane protein YesL